MLNSVKEEIEVLHLIRQEVGYKCPLTKNNEQKLAEILRSLTKVKKKILSSLSHLSTIKSES